jgi:hypothetical protein
MNIVTGDCPGVTIIAQAASRGQCSQLRGLPAAHEGGQKDILPTPGDRQTFALRVEGNSRTTAIFYLHQDNPPTAKSKAVFYAW